MPLDHRRHGAGARSRSRARPVPVDHEEWERRRAAEAEQQARVNAQKAQQRSSDTLTDLLIEHTGIDGSYIRPGSVRRAPTVKPGTTVIRAVVEVEMSDTEVLDHMKAKVEQFLSAPFTPDDEADLPAPPSPCLAPTAYPRPLLHCELLAGHIGPHRFADQTWTAVGKR